MPGYVDNLELPSIEDLSLDVKVLFAGKHLPERLKSKSFTSFNTSVRQILSSIHGR